MPWISRRRPALPAAPLLALPKPSSPPAFSPPPPGPHRATHTSCASPWYTAKETDWGSPSAPDGGSTRISLGCSLPPKGATSRRLFHSTPSLLLAQPRLPGRLVWSSVWLAGGGFASSVYSSTVDWGPGRRSWRSSGFSPRPPLGTSGFFCSIQGMYCHVEGTSGTTDFACMGTTGFSCLLPI